MTKWLWKLSWVIGQKWILIATWLIWLILVHVGHLNNFDKQTFIHTNPNYGKISNMKQIIVMPQIYITHFIKKSGFEMSWKSDNLHSRNYTNIALRDLAHKNKLSDSDNKYKSRVTFNNK